MPLFLSPSLSLPPSLSLFVRFSPERAQRNAAIFYPQVTSSLTSFLVTHFLSTMPALRVCAVGRPMKANFISAAVLATVADYNLGRENQTRVEVDVYSVMELRLGVGNFHLEYDEINARVREKTFSNSDAIGGTGECNVVVVDGEMIEGGGGYVGLTTLLKSERSSRIILHAPKEIEGLQQFFNDMTGPSGLFDSETLTRDASPFKSLVYIKVDETTQSDYCFYNGVRGKVAVEDDVGRGEAAEGFFKSAKTDLYALSWRNLSAGENEKEEEEGIKEKAMTFFYSSCDFLTAEPPSGEGIADEVVGMAKATARYAEEVTGELDESTSKQYAKIYYGSSDAEDAEMAYKHSKQVLVSLASLLISVGGMDAENQLAHVEVFLACNELSRKFLADR